jgi:hypothetical protein
MERGSPRRNTAPSRHVSILALEQWAEMPEQFEETLQHEFRRKRWDH